MRMTVAAGLGALALAVEAPPANAQVWPTNNVKQKMMAGEKIVAAGGLDVAGIEYLESSDGRLVIYDINANSNLRKPIGEAFGFDPFERVVDYLVAEIQRQA